MKTYIKTILILLLPLAMIVGYALWEEDLGLRKIELDVEATSQNTDISPINSNVSPVNINATSTNINVTSTEAERSNQTTDTTALDTARQRILFVGDSMLEGLSRRLCDYTMENGHELTSVIWYSSTSQHWAESDTLEYFIRKTSPTFIVVCLCSNELFVRDLNDRDRWLKEVVRKIGDIPFVWISPPNWTDDTGINELIIRNVGEQRYFDSRGLTLQRGRDKIHPTFKAAEKWMDSIAVWQKEKSAHPILLNIPKEKRKRDYKLYILTRN